MFKTACTILFILILMIDFFRTWEDDKSPAMCAIRAFMVVTAAWIF